MDVYTDDLNLVTDSKHKTYKFICQMHQSSSLEELEACIEVAKDAAALKADLFLQF